MGAPPITPTRQGSIDDGTWHQLVGVYHTGGTHDIYVDGTFEGSAPSSPIVANSADFSIGGIFFDGANHGSFTGLISYITVMIMHCPPGRAFDLRDGHQYSKPSLNPRLRLSGRPEISCLV